MEYLCSECLKNDQSLTCEAESSYFLRAKEKPRNKLKKLVNFVLLDLHYDLDMMLVRITPGINYILM